MVDPWSGLLSSLGLRTLLGLCGSRHTSIVCTNEQAAYRSVGSRVSLWLPASDRKKGVWPWHVQACAEVLQGGSEERELGNLSPSTYNKQRGEVQKVQNTWVWLHNSFHLSCLTQIIMNKKWDIYKSHLQTICLDNTRKVLHINHCKTGREPIAMFIVRTSNL